MPLRGGRPGVCRADHHAVQRFRERQSVTRHDRRFGDRIPPQEQPRRGDRLRTSRLGKQYREIRCRSVQLRTDLQAGGDLFDTCHRVVDPADETAGVRRTGRRTLGRQESGGITCRELLPQRLHMGLGGDDGNRVQGVGGHRVGGVGHDVACQIDPENAKCVPTSVTQGGQRPCSGRTAHHKRSRRCLATVVGQDLTARIDALAAVVDDVAARPRRGQTPPVPAGDDLVQVVRIRRITWYPAPGRPPAADRCRERR